ncbi:MAG: GntR family transcriptional regulator, partial [Paracoccaceae bacterium]
AIARRDEDAAYQALRDHISVAFKTRLKLDADKD